MILFYLDTINIFDFQFKYSLHNVKVRDFRIIRNLRINIENIINYIKYNSWN